MFENTDISCHYALLTGLLMHCSKPCVLPEVGAPVALSDPEVTHESDLSSEAGINFGAEKDFVAVINCHVEISSEVGISFEAGLC